MDPLSALAVAAAAFQFLELGGKLCAKGWEKYKQMQQDVTNGQELAQKEEELRKTFEELSAQISWFQQVSASIVVSQPPTPTQVKLLKLSSQCAGLSSDFERIKSQITLSNSPAINTRMRRSEKDARMQRDQKDIQRITKNMESLKRETIDFIFLSLWDDSKHATHWELHFSSQLDKLIKLLENADKLPINKPHKSVLSSQEASAQVENPEYHMQQCGTPISIMADEEAAGLRNALQPLIQPGNGPVSLKSLAIDMIKYFTMDSVAIDTIREELINILWKNDWKLNTSMASTINTNEVGRVIAAGIRFRTIETREDFISKNFENTYSWIFQDECPKTDGTPEQNSFPKWLDDDSKVYWITGKPGSGKSTLMKLILNQKDLRDRLSQSLGTLRLLLIKYYAWLSGDALQKSIQGFKRTILFQALKQYPDLAPLLTPRRWVFCQVLRNTSRLPKWETWEVEESFENLLSSCGETIKVALFIDGLDEFDTTPFEIVKCIQHMVARCPNGLKICVASRPWPEFVDEFNEGPMLQMHLLTENDMKIFVDENFKINKGFVEQREINPEETSQLLMDIVQRANGVFLWVSIVVRHLSSCFTEGQSVAHARQALEALPTDISSLYDTIWDGISPNNLADASYMIQVRRAFNGPLPWLILWLIEESRFATMEKIVFPETENKIVAAQRSLKRKLAARTKCILEINEGGRSSFVDFIHRTAHDWAVQPHMWQLICSQSSQTFDPYLYILKGEAFHLLLRPLKVKHDLDSVTAILRRAGQVRDIPESESQLVDYLNLVNERFESIVRICGETEDPAIERFMLKYGKNLLELAASFAILPYIKTMAVSHRSRLSHVFSGESLNLLERAIYGNYTDMRTVISQPSSGRRLATVRYLLEQDVYRRRVHIWNNRFRILRENTLEYSKQYPANSKYFSTVAFYLGEKESEFSIRSRIRSFLIKKLQ
ncbi:hypothetical protein GGI35DRAFT_465099 [Trichoderma velutinum]